MGLVKRLVLTKKDMSNMIKILVYGQIHDDTTYGFTYPDRFNPSYTSNHDDWMRSVDDYRYDKRVTNSSPTYAYWKNEYGNYYGIIIPAINDKENFFDEGIPRGGKLLIAVFTGKKVFTNGKFIIDFLHKLVDSIKHNDKELTNNNSYIDNLLLDVNGYLKSETVPYNPNPNNLKAFRTYLSKTDIEKIFQNPEQEEHLKYRQLLIAPKESITTALSVEYKEITTPIRVSLFVNKSLLPKGVSVDKYTIKEDDKLTITYTKKGYLSFSHPVPVSSRTKSPYYNILNDSEIIIKDALSAGIRFQRIIRLYCTSGQVPIVGIKVRLDRIYLNTDTNGYYIFPDDQDNHKITIEANGYKDEEVFLSGTDFMNGEKRVKMQALEESVPISLDLPDGIIQGSVKIKTNDPLYKHLTKANYDNIPINRYRIKPEGRKEPSEPPFNTILKWILIPIGALLTLYILYALFCLLDLEKKPWPFEDKEQTTEITEAQPADEVVDGNNESNRVADIAYLKKEDIWNKQKLNTDRYKSLLDFIHNGQIDEILREDSWFPDDSINGYWKSIYEYLSKIQNDSYKKYEAQEELKRIAKDPENIKLEDIKLRFHALEEGDIIPSDNTSTKPRDKSSEKQTSKLPPNPQSKTPPKSDGGETKHSSSKQKSYDGPPSSGMQ